MVNAVPRHERASKSLVDVEMVWPGNLHFPTTNIHCVGSYDKAIQNYYLFPQESILGRELRHVCTLYRVLERIIAGQKGKSDYPESGRIVQHLLSSVCAERVLLSYFSIQKLKDSP